LGGGRGDAHETPHTRKSTERTVAEVGVVRSWGDGVPGGAVDGGVLAEEALLLPDDGAVELGLGQLLVVVRVVQHLLSILGLDLEAVRGSSTENRDVAAGRAGHELAAGAVGLPLDKAVLVLAVVLVGEVDVLVLVRDEAVAVDEARPLHLEEVGHVLVLEFTRAADDGGGIAVTARQNAVLRGSSLHPAHLCLLVELRSRTRPRVPTHQTAPPHHR
jgi:hypothetical protein